MPGKDYEHSSKDAKPEANIASKQTSDSDRTKDLDDIDPAYRDEAKKAFQKDKGTSNEEKDQARTNSFSGSKKK